MKTGKDRQESDTDRGVSSVISVVLTVAITIVLVATVGGFVFEFGGSTSNVAPSVSLSVDQQGERLLITHTAGDTIDTSNVELTGVKGWGPSGQEFGAGDRISGTPEPGAERVDIVWETTESSSILRTVDVSNIEVSSLVVNDGFERGTGDKAGSWEQSNTGPGAIRTDERSLSGGYSMKQVDITSNYGRTIVSDPVDILNGQTYNFGGSYNVRNGSSATKYKTAMRIVWVDAQGAETEQEEFIQLDELNNWTELSVTETAPSDAVAARLKIEIEEFTNDDADIYWDETFIEKR